jgi:predicted RecA/RadA family phage recombinase
MGTTYLQPGRELTHANGSGVDIAADDVVVMGDCVGVALVDIADGESGTVSVAGVHTLAKVAGTAWTQGDKLDWQAATEAFTKIAGGAAYTGDILGCAFAAADAESADTTGEVALANPGTAE